MRGGRGGERGVLQLLVFEREDDREGEREEVKGGEKQVRGGKRRVFL